jgi:hypothetical protein
MDSIALCRFKSLPPYEPFHKKQGVLASLIDMSVPKNHHYVPVFYLERWTSAINHRVVQHRRVYDGRVVTSRRAPDGTACQRGLNSLVGGTAENREIIETAFMSSAIDNSAAPAIQQLLETKGIGLKADTVAPLIYFLLSLRVRHPEAVKTIRTEGARILLDELARDPSAYDALRSESDPPDLVTFMRDMLPLQFENFGILRLPMLMTDERLVKRMASMHWRVVDCTKASVDLLTSDRPCYLEGNLLDENRPTLIAFPASPRLLLLLSTHRELNYKASRGNVTSVVKRFNKLMVQSAFRYVYATGAHHLPLIEKWLRKL